jgi:hypothetical protein
MANPINPNAVDWSGENPGIYLREREDSPWLALALYFRVVTSGHGRGHGIVVLGSPTEAKGHPAAPNFCITDNQPLMQYLVNDFVTKFATFRQAPGLAAMPYLPATGMKTQGDAKSFYSETMNAAGVEATLRWEQLSAPFAVDVPPASSATGVHQMYSVFQEAQRASITVNGKPCAGNVTPRDFLGRRMNTAFLAFSETWLRPPKP